MKNFLKSISGWVRLVLIALSTIALSGCGKFTPPLEKDGKWYYRDKPLNGVLEWSKTSEEAYKDRNHKTVEKRGGRYTKIICKEGVPSHYIIEDYPGNNLEPAYDRIGYRNGSKHGLESVRDLAGNTGYRLWVDGRDMDGEDVLKLWDDDAIAIGITPSELATFKKWYDYTVEKSDTRYDMRRWIGVKDGYDWRMSSESQKKSVASKLASEDKHGNTSEFYRDALDALYDNSDGKALSVSIEEIAPLIEAGSTALPERAK